MERYINKNWLKNKVIVFQFILICGGACAQYAPPVGQSGSTAISMDSSAINSWAISCTLDLGLLDLAVPAKGITSVGSDQSAVGLANGLDVVSLGDGGSAVLEFESPIVNEEGADFAVFENSFSDSFLELAFVEVSSDGINFVRFPSYSLTQTTQQVGTFDTIDATKIHNLAGKYRAGYGTPFDLEDVKDSAGIDVMSITHVKVIDVIGSLDPLYASRDANGNIVNDPWKTAFSSGGFDLDAVGVIHSLSSSALTTANLEFVKVYPTIVADYVKIELKREGLCVNVDVFSMQGLNIGSFYCKNGISVKNMSNGVYLLRIYVRNGLKMEVTSKKIIVQHD